MKIGVILPLDTGPGVADGPRYADIRALAVQAERNGFDSIWVFDHLLYRFPDQPTSGVWEAWTMLSALAEATATVELGTLVLCTAFRNPALLAKMATALDEISGGRLILGLGSGWHEPELTAFGMPTDRLASRFAEALATIAPLSRTGAVDVHGEYYQAVDCVDLPRGPRPGGPPLLVAAFGPRMLRLTAEYADAWNTAWLGMPTNLPKRLAEMRAACQEVGRDPATLATTVGVNVVFPDLGAQVEGDGDPDKALPGTEEAIAAGLAAYDALGVAHVILSPEPNTQAAQARLAEGLAAFRAGVGR
ncbi:MAG TPA: LLM class flavin-dependent oxidoreductase [Thermomicrobiales bacterium]|jgi:alkanesulfonate monooxygenase SsuD/methylene tetrahydromethanopterin reductase-like flavin-dependent oxidoreductase (luciferase family)|nr:LLM class flavin-dependent oxidoreductase [Thermomicrobiales bacterium]